MVERMDEGIGQILAAIDAADLREKTLVVFTSDNGGDVYSRNAPFRGTKSSIWEGGTRVPCLVRWSGVIPAGKTTNQVGITMDWTTTFRRLAGLKQDPAGEDGIDLMPMLTDELSIQSRTLFWRRKWGPKRKGFKQGRAVRHGRWKLIVQENDDELLLFDLKA